MSKHVPSSELVWAAEGDPQMGELYRHRATGGVYEVVSVALDADDPRRRLIAYRHFSPSALTHYWVRSLAEFIDGRFEKLSDEGAIAMRVSVAKAALGLPGLSEAEAALARLGAEGEPLFVYTDEIEEDEQ